MPQPATAPVPPVVPVRGRGRRLARGLFYPLRFAYRRPVRAAVLGGIVLVVVALATLGGLAAYFQYHLRAARAEVGRGHNVPATRHLNACRWVQPEHPEVLLLAARVARRSGAWEESDALLDTYWHRYGDDDALVFERLLMGATRGDLEATAPLLRARIARGGAEVRPAREALVTGLLYRFLWADAEQALAAWLAAEPDDPAALLLAGKLEEQRAQTSRALLSYRRVVELDPDHDEARLRMTTLLLQLRQGEEALPHLAHLRARLPDSAEVKVQWVRALALQGRTDDARTALDDCLRAHPDYPAAHFERGKFALADGDDRTAEDHLRRAVAFDPSNTAARNQLALVLGRSGKAAEADRIQGVSRQLQADAERIDELVRGPLQTNPHDPSAAHEIGRIALRSGQLSEAVRWFHVALQIDPDYAPTHQELANYYHALGNPILAARHHAFAQRGAANKKP